MLFNKTKRGKWIESEKRTVFEGGGSLLLRGYRCPFCDTFNNIKRGKEKFCHECGAELREEATA